jgi:Ca-activated chloride channel homolog
MNSARSLVSLLIVAGALGSCAPVRANDVGDGTDAPTDRTLAPYFKVTSPVAPGADPLLLKDTHVEVTIAGVIAEVAVTQTYSNEGSIPLNAAYIFPGSTRAAVHGMVMRVGERIVHAQIQKRAEARRTFEAARAAGQTASLLEQERPNVFQMSLANILPGDEVQVRLSYTELLRPEEGVYEFVFPTVVGPRYSRRSQTVGPAAPDTLPTPHLHADEKPTATFGFDLQLLAGVPLAELRCPTHPVRIDQPAPDQARLTLAAEADATGHANRDLIVRYRLAGDAVHAGLLVSRTAGATDGHFLAMIQPPARVEPAAIPPREYIFVVDVSGSMHGFPLATARELLSGLIGGLREGDTFNVVLFAGSAAVLAPTSLPATPENLAAAIVLLERQQAGGGTELLPALETAFELPRVAGGDAIARTVVVVTDGYVDIEAEAFDLVRRQLGSANLFAFGIGSSVNRHLIEGLARAGQGEPFVVVSAEEAAVTAARFRRMIESPVLTRVRAQFDGWQVADITPPTLPDLFAQRPIVLLGKWRGDVTTARLRLAGTSGAGSFLTTLEGAQATWIDGSRALELLWARAQIADLEDRDLAGVDTERTKAITALGLAHGLLTKHTSFVAVDKVVRTNAPATATQAQAVPLPDGVSENAVGEGGVSTTPEPATFGLLVVAALALAAAWWRRASSTPKLNDAAVQLPIDKCQP